MCKVGRILKRGGGDIIIPQVFGIKVYMKPTKILIPLTPICVGSKWGQILGRQKGRESNFRVLSCPTPLNVL